MYSVIQNKQQFKQFPMTPQKFQTWLSKIPNLPLKKPSQIAKLKQLQKQLHDLNEQVQTAIAESQKKMIAIEDNVNVKTSQLVEIGNRSKSGFMELRKIGGKGIEKMRENMGKIVLEHEEQKKKLKLKTQALCTQLSHKKSTYSQSLSTQLQTIQTISQTQSASSTKSLQKLQIFLKSSLQKCNKIIQSQQKDLSLISQFETELLSRCQTVQKQYQSGIANLVENSGNIWNRIIGRVEGLIGAVDQD